MNTHLIEKYAAPVPRYTSYPTAPHFHAGVGAPRYAEWLGALDADRPVSVYLHVPFCAQMCWYCGCNTKVARRAEPVQAYAATLRREIDLVSDAVGVRHSITHLHWGGGTPTILAPAEFRAVMARLRQRFRVAPDAELAIKIDPRSLDPERARALADTGINRVSRGVQDFAPKVQRAINRVQSFEDTRRAAELIWEVGIAALNVDLMYGLPHQGMAEIQASIDLALDLLPDRISLFGYAHVPWMKTHQKMIDDKHLLSGETRWACAEAAARRLRAAGYRRIGFDHFAKSDDPLSLALDQGELRRNFQGYTNDRAETLIGLGASSIGSFPGGYVQNASSVREWARAVDGGRLPVAKGLEVSAEDLRRRRIINRLICDMSVDLADFTGDDTPASTPYVAERDGLAPMIADGLVRVDNTKIQITEQERPFVRNVCAVFDQYLAAGKARHSRAV